MPTKHQFLLSCLKIQKVLSTPKELDYQPLMRYISQHIYHKIFRVLIIDTSTGQKRKGHNLLARKKIDNAKIIFAVLNYHKQKDAADYLGISESTLSKRLADTDLKKQLQTVRKQQIDLLNNRIVVASAKALENLVEMLNSANEYAKYNASCKILSLAEKFISIEDIITRLEALEESNKIS